MARTVLLADGSTEVTYESPLPPGGHVEMPADWGATLGEDFRGQVMYQRHFGCPSGLEPSDRVILVIQRIDAFGTVALNGSPIGIVPAGGEPARFDITANLKRRNLLAILVELPRITADSQPLDRPGRDELPGGLVGEVRLQIEA